MKNKIIYMVFVVALFSCKNGKDSVNVKKLYYPTGEIKEIDTMLNDSIIIGTAYLFAKNGKIKAKEVHDSSGKLAGVAQYFWKNGNYLCSTNYINGLAQGECIAYDSLGNLYYKKFYFDDKEVGDYYIYNNNKVSMYKFFDFNERLATLIDYDKNGNISMNKRAMIFFDTLRVKLNPNGLNMYEILILQSNPLRTANKLIASYYDKDGKLMEKDSLITTGMHMVKLEKKTKSIFNGFILSVIQYDSILKKTDTLSHPFTYEP